VNFDYDGNGHVLSTRRYNSGGTNLSNVYYSYDSAGRLKGYVYPSGLWVQLNPDGADNIGSVQMIPPNSSTAQTVATLTYGPFSGPVRLATFGNAVQDTTALDQDYRVTSLQVAATSGNLTNRTNTFDAANNLKTVTDTISAANNQTLGYDVLNRINSAVSGTGGYGSLGWTYDKVGNLLTSTVGSSTTTYGYTPSTNVLASITNGGTTTVSTNANGNITSIPPANGSTAATFGYNVANRLNSVTGTSPAISGIVYDGFGQRYSKQDSGSSPVTYIYDLFGNLIEENNGGMVTDYIYVNGTPVGVYAPGSNPPTTGQLYYVHSDQQGTPQIVTDSSQTVQWSTAYQPYGTTPTIVSGIVQNLRFPGQYFDMEAGFYHNGFRDYMPNLGRYLESDPIGLVGGLNTYRYANANPGGFRDPNGTLAIGAVVGIISGGISGAMGAYLQHGSQSDIINAAVLGAAGGALVGLFDPTDVTSIAALSGLAGSVADALGQGLALAGNDRSFCSGFNWKEAVSAGLFAGVGGGIGAGTTLYALDALLSEGLETEVTSDWVSNILGAVPSSVLSSLGGLAGQQLTPDDSIVVDGVRIHVVVHEAVQVPLSNGSNSPQQ